MRGRHKGVTQVGDLLDVGQWEARMKYLRTAGIVVGALSVLMGVVWIFQGINVIPGSFMTGDIDWSYRGGVLAVVGLVVLFVSLRKPRANGS